MAEQEENKDNLPPTSDMEHWSKDQVRDWALTLQGVDSRAADTLYEQDITGPSLMLLETKDVTEIGVKLGPAKVIIHARDAIVNSQKEQPKNSAKSCKPYPFNRCHDTYRYVEGDFLDTPESGASNFVEPCHEYKAFTNTTEETKMKKFTDDVIRFAAACMNSRSNGTIHFGIGDLPNHRHGQVLGVSVGDDTEVYGKDLRAAICEHFEFKHKDTALICIKPPRFVGVLNRNNMGATSEKFVIEVDIVPDFSLCQENVYHCSIKKNKTKTKEKSEKDQRQFYVREGGSSCDLLALKTGTKPNQEHEKFVKNVPRLSTQRKEAEEEHLRAIKAHQQGSQLCQMITGGTSSLDRSYYEHYIIVTNKSHPAQLDSVDFLVELNPVAVLDFDPQSSVTGLCECFEKKSPVKKHSPEEYKITQSVSEMANKLQLTQSTSWVFCNGGADDLPPSQKSHWSMDKGASVRNVISFLCRKDILRSKKFLVVFVLLSKVNDQMDPLVETFSTFYQELKGTEQILCVCDNENAFIAWKNLIDARCGVDISNRCIYELSFSEVNGTILSLLSENRRSSRFLPGVGGSKVALEKKVERALTALDILCVNQCEGGNEEKENIEQSFYRGGEVSWWNFYFSEQPGSVPFIKRDKFDYIIDSLIPALLSLRKACVLFNLLHIPGCGGTTLAKHILWTLREKRRCALLVDCDADPDAVADQVMTLLTHGSKEQEPLPVMLMIDDFEDMEKVYNLQQAIDKQCLEIGVQSRAPSVILLNCMRFEFNCGPLEPTADTVYIENKLTDDEQKWFDQKQEEMDKMYCPAKIKTFYGFMLMKKNFSPEYFQSVVQRTFNTFDMEEKHSQLIAVLVLMSVYCKDAALSVSLCEEYLCRERAYCGSKEVEDGFKKFSTLVWSCDVRARRSFKGVRMIHSLIAQYCLKELNSKHKISKTEITNFLLTTTGVYECTQGKEKLMHDIYCILIKRNSLDQESHSQPSVHATLPQEKPGICLEQESSQPRDKKAECRFSPLVLDIERENQGSGESVLLQASELFQKNPFISQLLSRYYYLMKKDFAEAKKWAKNSKDLSPNNSFMSDTAAQAVKHELKYTITNERDHLVERGVLHKLLKLFKSALLAFRETQHLAVQELMHRSQNRRDNKSLNTSGFLGEIQVHVLLIEVLEKIPIFSESKVRRDTFHSVLSGSITVDQLKQSDPEYQKYIPVYEVLQEFAEMLLNVRCRMKRNFDFFDKFYVNLNSKYGMKESRDQIHFSELSRCFRKFAQLFCQTESERLFHQSMKGMLQIHKARQFIENEKVDTYSGILNCLSQSIKPEVLSAYKLIINSRDCSPAEKINYIYLNVVLSCTDLNLIEEPFHRLITLLCECLENPKPETRLPLYFIAVLLLWPQLHFSREESGHLRSYITHMKTAFDSEMKYMYDGKKPTVHFFLGQKRGYERIVHLGEITRLVNAGSNQLASMWENGVIWKNPKVQGLLLRVTGHVVGKNILAHTCIPDLNVEITPLFQSQLRAYKEGSTVSFFIGFSMKGPLAIDINDS